jgi:hypothetical protein
MPSQIYHHVLLELTQPGIFIITATYKNTSISTSHSHNRTPGQYSNHSTQRSLCPMRVISILQMRPFELADWRRLPKIGQITGPAGYDMSNLWGLTLTYRIHRSNGNTELLLLDSQLELERAHLEQDERSKLARSLGISCPLIRRSLWPVDCGTNPLNFFGKRQVSPMNPDFIRRVETTRPTNNQEASSGIRHTRAARKIMNIVRLGKLLSRRGFNHYCFLLPITSWRIYYKKYTTEHKAHSSIQNRGHSFFKFNATKKLVCLPRSAKTCDILSADRATLKLDNQKNGYRGVCIYQEANGDDTHWPRLSSGTPVHPHSIIRCHKGHANRPLFAHIGTKGFRTRLQPRTSVIA